MPRTGVAVLVVAVAVFVAACADDTPPVGSRAASSGANSLAPAASASPAERELARTLARTFAQGLQQGAPTQITPRQLDCLIDQFVAHLNDDVLTDLASSAPESGTVSAEERSIFVNAFDRCLPPDLASALRDRIAG